MWVSARRQALEKRSEDKGQKLTCEDLLKMVNHTLYDILRVSPLKYNYLLYNVFLVKIGVISCAYTIYPSPFH